MIDIPRLILALRLSYRCEVRCFMTESAERFVSRDALAAVSGNRVVNISGGFDVDELNEVPLLVAPASANAISAMAHGLVDHPAARLTMNATGPVFVCPAMNSEMWEKPTIRRATQTIVEFGYILVGPSEGIEVETLQRSSSSLASTDEIISAMLSTLPW